MSLPERFSRLHALIDRLPFAVDDFDAAAAAFVRWREHGDADARRTAQHWAYCYVVWYFYGRFAQERTAGPADLDAVIEKAFAGVAGSFDTIEDPARFPQFASVVCRNLLLSYRARRRDAVEVDEATATTAPRGAEGYDRILTRRLIHQALAALPPSVAEVARMRLIEKASYQEIVEATGYPVATARAYYHRALATLRDDPDLRALHENTAPPSALADTYRGAPGRAGGIGPNGVKMGDPKKKVPPER